MAFSAMAAGCADNSVPKGAAARTRSVEPPPRGVEHAPRDAAVLRDRTRGLRTGVRRRDRLLARRDRRDREQPQEAHVRQYDRGAGASGRAAQPHRGAFLQSARSRHVGRNAGDRPARAAQADRTVERHFAQPRAVRPGETGLRASGTTPQRGQETAGGHLSEFRTQRCGPFRRRQGTLPQVHLRTLGADAPVRAERAGRDQRLHAQHHRSEGGGRTARLREGRAWPPRPRPAARRAGP